MLRIIEDLSGDWRRLDERIENLSGEIVALTGQDKGCEQLVTIPGIGPLISSAIVAAIGTGDPFSKGRDFGAWLGLVPKQMSTERSSATYRGAAIVIYARCLFRQPGSCWSRSGPSNRSAMASSRGSRQPKNGCTTTCWRLRSPTNSPASPGRFSITGVPSSTSRPMQQRPDLLDPRARRPGRRNGRQARTKEQHEARRLSMT